MASSPTGSEEEKSPSSPSKTSVKMYKREPSRRIFVNRSLMLERVKFYGFDMDYTLAVYKSPDYETLGFDLLKRQMVNIGYPDAIAEFEYDPTFPIRGLWFDSLYGNLLKVDAFGNILVCIHGFQFLRGHEIHNFYANKFVQMDEKRFRIFNTLYELPVLYILACLVDFFSNVPDYTRKDDKMDNDKTLKEWSGDTTKTGVIFSDVTMTYKSIYQDVLDATQVVHDKEGPLKQETVKNVDKYVLKDDRLPILLDRIRDSGSKVFLATNSDYTYSNKIMTYLFDYPKEKYGGRDWTSFFDYIVVDAKKPLFFGEGTILRQVDKKTGKLKLGTHTGPISSEHIYSGGCVDVFSELMKTYGSEVLYVGDHIFGDILKSKKARGWRTFLCVPEISLELMVWTEKRSLFTKLEKLDCKIGEMYKNLDSSCESKPADMGKIHKSIRKVTHEMDMAYGILGSLFRSGSRQTFFASQVMRYADLYASTFFNFIHYPFSYVFRAPPMLMSHESTVEHDATIDPSDSTSQICIASRSRTDEATAAKRNPLVRSDSIVPRAYAPTPRQFTQVQEESDDEYGKETGDNEDDDNED